MYSTASSDIEISHLLASSRHYKKILSHMTCICCQMIRLHIYSIADQSEMEYLLLIKKILSDQKKICVSRFLAICQFGQKPLNLCNGKFSSYKSVHSSNPKLFLTWYLTKSIAKKKNDINLYVSFSVVILVPWPV